MLPAIIGGGLGLLSGIFGASEGDKQRKQALDLINQTIKEYEAMGVPTAEAQRITLDKYRSAGQLTPELEQAVMLGDSAMGGIDVDPTYKNAQLDALSELGRIGQSGGMTGTDLSNLEKLTGNIDSDEKGARDAIAARMKSQGTYGSGLDLAMQLANQQNASTQAHSAGLQTAGMAQDRALQAIQSAGQMGGNIRGQEFGEQAQVAGAQDAISKFNAANRQDVQARNVASNNSAQQYNLGNAQNIQNANVDNSNKAEIYNKELIGKEFSDQMALQQGKANARAGAASNLNASAKDTAAVWGGIGDTLAKAGTGVSNYYDAEEKKPKTITLGAA